jgi:NitT/TauT family transport system substrate-binding protein
VPRYCCYSLFQYTKGSRDHNRSILAWERLVCILRCRRKASEKKVYIKLYIWSCFKMKGEVNSVKKSIIVLFVTITILLIGCGSETEESMTSGEVINVATNYWPGQFWIDIATEKGWFEDAGLNVEYIDTNADYFQSLQDVVDGKIDVNQFTLYDLMNFRSKGVDLIGVLNSDISSGADGIVTTKDINYVYDLQGKKIGIQKGTFTEFMMDVMLEEHRLTSKDVIPTEVASDTTAPFVNGTVDALLTWEPHLSNAVQEGDGHIIFDSSDIPGLIPDIHVFKKEFIEQRPEDVQAYVSVWHTTTEYIKANPDEAFQIIADIYNLSVEEVETLAENARILDLEDNKIAFSYAAGFDSLHGAARQINDFMVEKEITNTSLDSTDFIDARFIRGVEE